MELIKMPYRWLRSPSSDYLVKKKGRMKLEASPCGACASLTLKHEL